ncbi:MAG: hypothetical protein N3D10_01000 [Candidatus Micrarchaeota archaeon]|nr:hypothetical protein [Candidatus Micrarchaeota archaeon]
MHKAEDEDKTSQAFLDELTKISEVEKKSELLLDAAEKKAQEIIQHANIESSKIVSEALEKSLKTKNEIILEKKKQADKEAKMILDSALKKAEEIKKISLSNSEVSSLLDILLE